jgi:hypothetical protein
MVEVLLIMMFDAFSEIPSAERDPYGSESFRLPLAHQFNAKRPSLLP